MYTSGSTGRPKGVAVAQRGIARLARWAGDLGIGPGDTFLQLAPFAFDASTLETWGALLNGARIVVPPPGTLSLEEIGEQIELHRVTVLWLTAGLFHQMVDGALERLAPVRLLLAGGDALSVPHVERLLSALPGTRLVNGYGPTENTTFTACHLMQGPQTFAGSVPLGRPIHGTRVVILDRTGRPVPVGVPGELCTGGAGLARGYLHRPDLTAEAFVPDDFGERLYRTGDLARFLPDGRLEFLGRIDRQVKIRGFRVEPGEIETLLSAHPEVQDAAVVVGQDAAGKRLVACVVPAPGSSASPSDLRTWLAERLPEPMVPAAFLILEALPLTPNGKVDRRALARLAPETGGAGPWEAPRTPAEELLAGLWAGVLGVDRVGRQDDFFALGGHSLLATRLVSRIRETFGAEIPLRTLFEAPTLAELAARIDSEDVLLPPITPTPRPVGDIGPLPLSFAQERLWFLDELDPGTPTLNLPFSAWLREPLDDLLLARALDEVVRRHEVLRTTFGSEGGQPHQRIAPALHVPLPVVDLRALAPADREREAFRLEAEEVLLSFDLARGPLVRARIVRTGDAERLLLITLHHIVGDGWSVGLLMRELRVLYAALAAGRPSPLAELPVQYADYASWQRRWLGGEALETQIAYWRGKLGDPLPVLDLPADRPRPAVQRWRGGSVTHVIEPGLSGRLAAFGRREGATLFMVLLAGFQVLLGRLSGDEDVIVGTPVAGRGRAETEALIGCFLNNLALRTDLGGEPSFRELLGRARDTALEAYDHQDVPFERLLEELRVPRDLSRTPLFQVFLNMLNFPTEEGGLGGTDGGMTPAVPSKFDLTIYAGETRAGLRLELVYNADLFDGARIVEMAAQLEGLLAQAVDDPERRIDDLSLVTAAARGVLPDPSLPLPGVWRGPVSQALAASAARSPGEVAVTDGREAWTWAELDEGARRLARRLRAAGIETGDVAAVWAHRAAGLPQAVLGALRAGAAVMVLDPAYPPSRLVDYLRTGRPRAWLGVPGAPLPPAEVVAALDELGCSCRLDLPPGPGAPGDVPEASGPEPEIGPDDAAVLTFTSGSTGRPKGVVGRHGPLTAFYPWMGERFGITAADRFGMLSALSHDPLQRDLFTPVWFGATLCIPDPERIGSPGYLADWVRRERISILHLTPAMLEMLTDAAEEAPDRRMPSLRLAFVVGDLLKRSDVARLQRLAPGLTCVNLYGSTETQRSVSFYIVPRPEDTGARVREAIPLGRGMEGVQVLIRGRSGRLAGVGELGEIHLRSGWLARGYLDDPVLTAAKFLPDLAGGRLYRTGDLGRYLPDGNAEFAGRVDAQVKIRGFRIEPGEIEAALARFPGVKRCAVVPWEKPGGGDRRLVAYVVPAAGEELAPALLRGWLAERLPAYMVPADWVTLDALPLTRTGKLDRRALPAPERQTMAGRAPRTDTERQLAAIWSELLDLEAPGVEDDFFDLGGHSLLATQLLSRIHDRFGAALPLRAVFERPTIAGLAALLAESRGEVALPPLVRRPPGEDPPLSFAQQRLWFLQQLDPGGSAYNMYQALRMEGTLDEAALAEALREVVRRQEALRSHFVTRGTRTVQVVDPVPETVLPVVDLAALPAAPRPAEAERILRQEALRPFDIERGPVLRALLVRLGPAERRLLIAMHHIVSDGWSMGVFVAEMTALYAAFAAGRPSPLSPLPIQYADFAAWQREWLAGEVLEREVAWWRERLTGAPSVLDLPLDRPRPALHTFHGGRRSRRLGTEASEALLRLGRDRNATPFMTGLALFAALLRRHTGATDLVVGTPIANRNRQETEPLIGFFANTLALRLDLSGAAGFGELLGRVRETALGAYSHQDVPFEKLVEDLAPARTLRHSPLFQVMFVMGAAPVREMDSGGLRIRVVQIESQATKFDLTLAIEEEPGGLGLTLGYNSDLFFATTIERLLDHAEALAAGLAADPGRPIADLPMLAPAERHQLLREWNDTAAPVSTALLHELFEARAAEAPEAPAVLEEGTALSYGDLDARGDQLARHLRRLGVGPEVRVGLCVERSADLVVGILGILKAGGAWVPLDPAWPDERLALLPEDAGLRLLLTQEHLVGRLATTAQLLCLSETLADPTDPTDHPSDPSDPSNPSELTPDNAAYVIYTSGSTGRPNGVLVPHRAAVSFALAARGHFTTSPTSRVLQAGSPGFDMSVKEIFMTLAAGAALCIATEDERRDPALLAERISRQRITVAALTPKVVSLLPQAPARGLLSLGSGGEACPAGLAPRWASGRRFLNCYGPTETTVYATVEYLTPEETGEPAIGRPIENVQVFLLDVLEGDFREVPLGVAGELCLGGVNLARGYLDRPDRTAARFIPHPFAAMSGSMRGARLYRTGDLARQRPDGRLDYLGRIDQQVKISGVRIEPGEIETALLRHPAVRAAVVEPREDAAGDRALIAWLAAEPAPSASELRAFLARSLPDALIPAAFVVLPALPLNASGKVDRKALPAPRRNASDAAGVPPRTPLERFLADLWKEVLGIERIGVHDNFFELGGSSIKAAILTNLLQERLGEYVYVVAFFDAPTVARLAVYLEAHYPAAVARLSGRRALGDERPEPARPSPLVRLQPGGPGRPFFCVHPVGGNVLCYTDLARDLAPDRPVYAFQALGLAGGPPQATIEEMAATYLEDMLAVQPEGPWLLGGWSLGGLVAWEMAQTLRRQGGEVDLLVLIDVPAPQRQVGQPLTEVDEISDIDLVVEHLVPELDAVAAEALRSEASQLNDLEAVFQAAQRLGALPPGIGTTQVQALLRTYRANVRAARRYEPQPYDGRLLLIRATEGLARLDPLLGWGDLLAGEREILDAEGDHYTILQGDAVHAMARALRERLA